MKISEGKKSLNFLLLMNFGQALEKFPHSNWIYKCRPRLQLISENLTELSLSFTTDHS